VEIWIAQSFIFSASPQYFEGIGAFKGIQRFALGAFPVAKVALCHSATDLIFVAPLPANNRAGEFEEEDERC
jgi:hypothetical protein